MNKINEAKIGAMWGSWMIWLYNNCDKQVEYVFEKKPDFVRCYCPDVLCVMGVNLNPTRYKLVTLAAKFHAAKKSEASSGREGKWGVD